MTNPDSHRGRDQSAEDTFNFADENTGDKAEWARPARKWKVLIVDDDPEVHAISALVLRDFEFDGGALELLSAYSGDEGKRAIEENPDIAVVLLDVVMETDRAGLDLVRYIRDDLHNRFVRIILRTGQPGEAPERWVVINYDINDYKEKTELTSDKLMTSVLSALRAYRDITLIESSRRGLEQIIASSRKLFEHRSLSQFCSGILHQLMSILDMGNDALYARTSGFAARGESGSGIEHFIILAGTGSYSGAIGAPINTLNDSAILNKVRESIKRREAIIDNGEFIAYFPTSSGAENIVYTQIRRHVSDVDKRLLRVFATNLSVAFDNLYLNREITQTQVELIYTLGEVVESRCNETGHHVQRVAEYSRLMGELLNLPMHDIELLKLAAPLHDLGKIGIADAILHKPGRLSQEELISMRAHPTIGFHLLRSSGRPMLRSAAIVAQQHHERWDGTGYPNGLVGNDIHIFGRIVSIADVFDALTHKRPYKNAWTPDEAFQYIHENGGSQFDPELVTILLAHRSEFQSILERYPD